MITFQNILEAQTRISNYLTPTPLEMARGFEGKIWLKLEQINPTHSFKIRGALNATLALDKETKQSGIITASSGNFAQALAYSGHLLNLSVKVVMPTGTPKQKVTGVEQYNAEIVLMGDSYDCAEEYAKQLARRNNLTFISSYNNPQVIAGAGTIGLEIQQQNSEIERVIVPVAGGGLISGLGIALRSKCSNVEIVGVNSELSPVMYQLFYGKNNLKYHKNGTLAEALSGGVEDGLTVHLCKKYVSSMVTVNEEEIAYAIRWTLSTQNWLVEGGGVVALAALLSGKVSCSDKRTVAILTGSNIDYSTLKRALKSDFTNAS